MNKLNDYSKNDEFTSYITTKNITDEHEIVLGPSDYK